MSPFRTLPLPSCTLKRLNVHFPTFLLSAFLKNDTAISRHLPPRSMQWLPRAERMVVLVRISRRTIGNDR